MPRRIELELTSERPDGTWTWRAAGAREPRGELEASILPSDVKVGDVLRAEADITIDGITVLSVLPPKGGRTEPERIEIIGPPREFTPVTSTLSGRGEGREGRPRREGRDGADRPGRPDRPDRAPRPRREDRPRRPRPEGADRPRPERAAPPPPRPKPKKLRPSRVHRDALMAALSPEQFAIADQLFRGGMPSVRQALEEQNAKAKVEGLPEMPSATVLGIAEDLLPRVRVADWLDRAEAAIVDADEIALRDLRAVVASSDDVARDESTRELASRLREVLARRSSAEQDEWLNDLRTSVTDGRVVRALRLSSRPPQPGENLPEEIGAELSTAAGTAMSSEITSDRWATLLDAVAYSPIRRTITPAGAPAEPTEELLSMVRKHAGRVPAAATLFGIEPPAPPAPKRPPRAPRPAPKPKPVKASHPPLPPLPGGGRRIPPPPRPHKDADTAPPGEVPASAVADSPHPHGDELPIDAPVEVDETAATSETVVEAAVEPAVKAPAEPTAVEPPVQPAAVEPDAEIIDVEPTLDPAAEAPADDESPVPDHDQPGGDELPADAPTFAPADEN